MSNIDDFEEPIEGWDVPMPESGIKCERCDSMDAIDCTVWDETQPDGYLHTPLCADHAKEEGHCMGCGNFCAGIASYNFHHPGWCDNCWDEITSDEGYEDEDEY